MKQPSVVSVTIATKNEPNLSTESGENFIIMWKYNILHKTENHGQKYKQTSIIVISNTSNIHDQESAKSIHKSW